MSETKWNNYKTFCGFETDFHLIVQNKCHKGLQKRKPLRNYQKPARRRIGKTKDWTSNKAINKPQPISTGLNQEWKKNAQNSFHWLRYSTLTLVSSDQALRAKSSIAAAATSLQKTAKSWRENASRHFLIIHLKARTGRSTSKDLNDWWRS